MPRQPSIDYGYAVQQYKLGRTMADISREVGVDRTAISQWFKRHGITHLIEKKRKYPTDTTSAYFAGLFDGEGHATIVKAQKRDCVQYELRVGITQKNRTVLDILKREFGVGHIYCSGKGVHVWRITAIDALHVLQILLPYLIIKREVAELAIDFQKRTSHERGIQEWQLEKRIHIQELNAL